VFENLPAQGQSVLPYIGIVGDGDWDLEALTAVSQLPRNQVEAGLRQLAMNGFLHNLPDGSYRCSPLAQQFALERLHGLGGPDLVRSAQAVYAHYSLRHAVETTQRFRQTLLDDFLQAPERKRKFSQALRNAFFPDESKSHVGGASAAIQSTIGPGDYDLVQEAFEDAVLSDPEFLKRWTDWLNSENCLDQKHQLEHILDWAVDQAYWRLVRRFALLSIGTYSAELVAMGDKQTRPPLFLNRLSFGPLRGVNLARVQIDGNLRGVRLVGPSLTDCELVTASWRGVHLYHPALTEVDMVGLEAPGLVVRDAFLIDLDLRQADLRGALFYNCFFRNVNFRHTDLSEAEFVNSGGSGIDLRGANLECARFTGCTLNQVLYYEVDTARLENLRFALQAGEYIEDIRSKPIRSKSED
jgi:hypothetical protein